MEGYLSSINRLIEVQSLIYGVPDPDGKLENYKIPTQDALQALTIELYFVQAVFLLTICYTLYNIVAYLTLQKRFKNWLITLFYILSMMVLVSRVTEFIFVQ